MKTLKETIQELKQQGYKYFTYECGCIGLCVIADTNENWQLLNRKVKSIKNYGTNLFIQLY